MILQTIIYSTASSTNIWHSRTRYTNENNFLLSILNKALPECIFGESETEE